jgi:hypothetical protein
VFAGVTADPGITIAVSGQTPAEVQATDPTGYRLYDFAIRMGGLNLVLVGLLMSAVLLVPYRARQRWAWAVMWTLPAWASAVPAMYLAFGLAPDQPPAPPTVSGPIVAALASAALRVDRRRFVSRPAAAPSAGAMATTLAAR